MKKVLVVCVAVAALMGVTSCEKDSKGMLDPNSILSIRPAKGVKAEANPEYLTAREIIEQGETFWFISAFFNTDEPVALAIDDWNRDLKNNRFKVGGNWVILDDGALATAFIDAKDMVVVTDGENLVPKDTIAYVPNDVMHDAAIKIRAAYAKEDYAACYVLFDQAFRFLPTTGKEFREMQAEGKN